MKLPWRMTGTTDRCHDSRLAAAARTFLLGACVWFEVLFKESVVGNPFSNSPELSTFCRNTDCFDVLVSPVNFIDTSSFNDNVTNL